MACHISSSVKYLWPITARPHHSCLSLLIFTAAAGDCYQFHFLEETIKSEGSKVTSLNPGGWLVKRVRIKNQELVRNQRSLLLPNTLSHIQ